MEEKCVHFMTWAFNIQLQVSKIFAFLSLLPFFFLISLFTNVYDRNRSTRSIASPIDMFIYLSVKKYIGRTLMFIVHLLHS